MTDETRQEEHDLPKPRRRWGVSLLIGGVILCCGMVIGGAITAGLVSKRFGDYEKRSIQMPERVTEKLSEELNLTADQAEAIEAILERHDSELRTIRKSVRDRLREQSKSMRDQVAAVLTPEQAAEWNERFGKLHRRWDFKDRNGDHDKDWKKDKKRDAR